MSTAQGNPYVDAQPLVTVHLFTLTKHLHKQHSSKGTAATCVLVHNLLFWQNMPGCSDSLAHLVKELALEGCAPRPHFCLQLSSCGAIQRVERDCIPGWDGQELGDGHLRAVCGEWEGKTTVTRQLNVAACLTSSEPFSCAGRAGCVPT